VDLVPFGKWRFFLCGLPREISNRHV